MVSGKEMNWFDDDNVIGDPIGAAGTFGITYQCYKRNDNTKTLYAVKQISKAKFYQIELNARLDLIQNMKNEIEVMKILNHENIVKLKLTIYLLFRLVHYYL